MGVSKHKGEEEMKLEYIERQHTTRAYLLMIITCLATYKFGLLVLIALIPLFLASFMDSDISSYEYSERKKSHETNISRQR